MPRIQLIALRTIFFAFGHTRVRRAQLNFSSLLSVQILPSSFWIHLNFLVFFSEIGLWNWPSSYRPMLIPSVIIADTGSFTWFEMFAVTLFSTSQFIFIVLINFFFLLNFWQSCQCIFTMWLDIHEANDRLRSGKVFAPLDLTFDQSG